jgi:uncharacterized membrane protein
MGRDAAGIGAVAMFLVFKVIMPAFRAGRPYRSFGYFGALGKDSGEVMLTLATHPLLFFTTIFSADRIMFLVQLLQPLAIVVPFLSLTILFVFPDLILNLLTENSALRVIPWHYNVTVGAFLFVAAIFGIRRLSGYLERRYGRAPYVVGFGVLLLCLSATQWTSWLNLNDYRQPPQYEALMESLMVVPQNASVLVPQTMLPQVSERWHFSTIQHWLFHRKPTDPPRIFQYQYVIIDRNERQVYWPIVPEEIVRAYATNPDYELVYNKMNVVVFRRKGEDVLVGTPAW